jgi:predicted AAA+ superfamily ATPase
MIKRQAEQFLRRLASSFPVVAVTGPRQSGKTTLVRKCFDQKTYVSLEDLDQREFAAKDPRGFLNQFPEGAILDEAQRCPDLFSYLQTRVDFSRTMGQFILTGSQQFGLLSQITQSLAGRVGMLTLLPLSAGELSAEKKLSGSPDEQLITGGYPAIYDRQLDPAIWLASYVNTYVERDVRQLINVRDLANFQRFLRLCAGRTGQLLNLSDLANDCGISHNTANAWISVLEASYLVFRLAPHHRNFNKRLVKNPKLYFLDTGLAAWLLGIKNNEALCWHPLRGALFETWVVSELLKSRYHAGLPSNLFFWRDHTGTEVDVVIEDGDSLHPVEIKSGATINTGFFTGLEKWLKISGPSAGTPWLVYGGTQTLQQHRIKILSWSQIGTLPV